MKSVNCGDQARACLVYPTDPMVLVLRPFLPRDDDDGSVKHGTGFGRMAFACPTSHLPRIQALVSEASYEGGFKPKILTPLVSLDTPGKATVSVVIIADLVSDKHLLIRHQIIMINMLKVLGWYFLSRDTRYASLGQKIIKTYAKKIPERTIYWPRAWLKTNPVNGSRRRSSKRRSRRRKTSTMPTNRVLSPVDFICLRYIQYFVILLLYFHWKERCACLVI